MVEDGGRSSGSVTRDGGQGLGTESTGSEMVGGRSARARGLVGKG